MLSRNVESHFSVLPSVDIERSKFDRSFGVKTTFNAGELIPIFVDEVLPGDTFTLDTSCLIRMSTPIFPVMDNCYLDTYFFFVPNRLVWEHWKEFNGENTDGYWTQTAEYQVPQLKTSLPNNIFTTGSIGDYFGLPTLVGNLSVSALPFRAYTLIWNEWFRDQNTMPPAYFTKSDSDYDVVNATIVNSSDDVFASTLQSAVFGAKPLPVSKFHDYFTSCLPQPQKGPSVDLPLFNDKIPVGSFNTPHSYSDSVLMFRSDSEGSASQFPTGSVNVVSGVSKLGIAADDPSSGYGLYPTNLYADVSNVAVATISQLRQAFQIQRLYEKDARGGTRYREILKSHFGVTSPDARQQVPEYLGGKRIPINIDQVLQTSATNDVSPQGNTSAFSMTTDVDNTFTKSFTEHGFIIGVACVRTDHTYQQGVERFWSRKGRFDFYWPTLAHLSEQAVLVKEIFATGSDSDNDAFGYQEAWADYRYKPSRVTGSFRHNYVGSLDAWHYADWFAGGNENFVLNSKWLSETTVNIDRTLAVTSSQEHQFISDFYFKMSCVRPMPLYSVPGLIDHF